MPSEMRIPEIPEIDRFKDTLEERLRLEVLSYRRAALPRVVFVVFGKLKALAKPLAQSGAMALTALAVIVAISATPAARSGDLVTPAATPLAAPSSQQLIESDSQFVDFLPADDTIAIQEADISDIASLGAE